MRSASRVSDTHCAPGEEAGNTAWEACSRDHAVPISGLGLLVCGKGFGGHHSSCDSSGGSSSPVPCQWWGWRVGFTHYYRCKYLPRLRHLRAQVPVPLGETTYLVHSRTACPAGLQFFGCWSCCQITALVPVVIAELFLFQVTFLRNSPFIPPLPGRQFGVLCTTEIQLKLTVCGTWQRGTLGNGDRGWITKQPNQNCQLMPLKTLNSPIKGFIGPQGFHCAIRVLEGAYCKLLALGESAL